MTTDNTSQNQQTNVRIGRSIRLTTAVAIGSTVTVGLGVYLLLGPIYSDSGSQTPTAYALMIFFTLPLVLALAERSSVTPGRGGLFNLSRSAGSVPLAFSTGWLLLGGLVGLAAQFAWVGGLALSELLSLFFKIQLDGRWLGALLVLLVLLRSLSHATGIWRRRTTFVFAAIVLLFFIFFIAWFAPVEIPSTWVYFPSSSMFGTLSYLVVGLWGLHFVLDRRDELRRPRRRMLPALFLPILLGAAAGAAAAAALLLYPSLTYADPLPLVSLAHQLNPLLGLLVLLTMFFFGLIGINESLNSLLKLSSALSGDGFLPEQLQLRRRIWQRPFYTRLFFAILTPICVLTLPSDTLIALSALAFVLATVLVNIQELRRSQAKLDADRWPKLPFHPLVPGLAAALGLSFVFVQDLDYLLSFIPWIVAGTIIYIAYSREGAISVRRRDSLVAGAVLPAKKIGYRVMVAISEPADAASLIRLGAQIAATRDGLLVILRVTQSENDEAASQHKAISAWQELNDLITAGEDIQVPITPLVRLAPDASLGILTTVWEEKIDIILLGWPADRTAGIGERDGTIGQIVHRAQCQVVVLHGNWPETVKRVVVPVVSAGHSPAALSLGQDLSSGREEGDQVVAMRVIPGKLTEEKRQQAKRQLSKTLDQLDDPSSIEGAIIGSKNTKTGILQESGNYDALLLGLSEEGFLAETDFSGLPVEIALAATPPTLLVKRREKPFQYWQRRSWDELASVLPTLTRKRQAIVGAEMRGDASADIDFYFLMVMAASIALLGLLRNSAAVIIGAMLVAPLMSPILAMSHSIVRGQLTMLREAAESTMNGIVMAITVAALLSLLLLTLGIPILPTDEILARTEPNFLDLLVALASGAAAAYAISRSEVGAALPGVAIAAALVPPLAVAGYGLGTVQFDLAAGSILLFLTNLAAIILAAAVIFLLLGFRPPVRDDRDEQTRFGLKMAVVALILIAIPLFATTRVSANQAARDKTIYRILEQNWPPNQAQVVDVVVAEQWNEDLKVSCTIFDYTGVVNDQAIAQLQVELSNAIDEPVNLAARTINAQLTNYNGASAARLLTTTPTPTETAVPKSTQTPPPTKTSRPVATETPSPFVTATKHIEIDETPTLDMNGTTAATPVETNEPGMTLTVTGPPPVTAVP